jgi:hypothetical protein
MGNLLDELEGDMRCPRCGEFSEMVTDSIMFPDERCCPACEEVEIDRHVAEGCEDVTCPCHESAPGGL